MCYLLTLWRQVIPKRKPLDRAPESILFIKLIEQGATVLAHNALQEAIAKVGAKRVFFILFQENKPILEYLELVPKENIISIRSDSLLLFVKDILAAIFRIRAKRIEASIDLEFFTRATAILAYLCGVRIRVGLHRFTSEQPYRGDLLTHRVIYNPYMHMAQHYLLLLRSAFQKHLDAPGPKEPWQNLKSKAGKVAATKEELAGLRARLNSLQPGFAQMAPLIVLHPNSADKLRLRKWPLERYQELTRKILAKYPNAAIILTGGREERADLESLKDISPTRCINLAGQTDFREFLALFDLADVLVSNDSGPTHFATLKDIGVVCLFGPETPALFAPLGEKVRVVYNQLSCSPCLSILNHRFSACQNNLCMQGISVEQVNEQIQELLEQRTRA